MSSGSINPIAHCRVRLRSVQGDADDVGVEFRMHVSPFLSARHDRGGALTGPPMVDTVLMRRRPHCSRLRQ